jgi:hypothetical protein
MLQVDSHLMKMIFQQPLRSNTHREPQQVQWQKLGKTAEHTQDLESYTLTGIPGRKQASLALSTSLLAPRSANKHPWDPQHRQVSASSGSSMRTDTTVEVTYN